MRLLSYTPVDYLIKVLNLGCKTVCWSEREERNEALFVLSTGRVGTRTVARLLGMAPKVLAFHEPLPKLYVFNKLAYCADNHEGPREALLQGFKEARGIYLRPCTRTGRRYVETSPQVTFLAPLVAQALPNAKFVHLIRDPRQVVRSGVRRGWYGGHMQDSTRITPLGGQPAATWGQWEQLQKLAWLWQETNRYIEAFTSRLDSGQYTRVFSENLFNGNERTLTKLFSMLDSEPPPGRKVKSVLDTKMNAQKTGACPEVSSWTPAQKQRVWDIAGPLAERYGYRPD